MDYPDYDDEPPEMDPDMEADDLDMGDENIPNGKDVHICSLCLLTSLNYVECRRH